MKQLLGTHSRWRTITILVIAAVSIVFLTSFLNTVEFVPERWEAFGMFQPTSGEVGNSSLDGLIIPPAAYITFSALMILGLGLFAFFQPRKFVQTVITAAIFFLLIAIFVENINLVPPEQIREPENFAAEFGVQDIEPLPDYALPDYAADQNRNWYVIMSAIAIASLTTIIGYRWWLSRRTPVYTNDKTLTKLSRDAEQTIVEIETGYDLRSAILNCYTKMVQTVQSERNILLTTTMTAREFEEKLAAHGLPNSSVSRLTRLFETVRYSPEQLGERERREAISCLSEIVESVGLKSAELV